MQEPSRTYKSIQESLGHLRAFKSNQGRLETLENAQERSRTFKNEQEHSKTLGLSVSVQEHSRMFESIQNRSRACTSIFQEHSRNMQIRSRASKNVREHSRTYLQGRSKTCKNLTRSFKKLYITCALWIVHELSRTFKGLKNSQGLSWTLQNFLNSSTVYWTCLNVWGQRTYCNSSYREHRRSAAELCSNARLELWHLGELQESLGSCCCSSSDERLHRGSPARGRHIPKIEPHRHAKVSYVDSDFLACIQFSSIATSKNFSRYCSLPPNSVHMLSLLIESKVRLPATEPTTSRAVKREMLRTSGEREFFLSAVRDIATDLDLKSLSFKIVDNLAVLLDVDYSSLFLVEGPRGKRVLVSKVFDIHCGAGKFLLPANGGASGDNEIQVPWGVGILGHVAETGETVNLQVACEDPRFDDEVDRITGYHTESLLCMAVRSASDEIIAVAQLVNKNPDKDDGHFTSKDEKNLLEVVHDLFEEQTSLEKVVLKIMQRAQRLLKCERAAVLLVDENSQDCLDENIKKLTMQIVKARPKSKCDGLPEYNQWNKTQCDDSVADYLLSLAERVAESGQVLNVSESQKPTGAYALDVNLAKPAANVKSLLAMPIRNSSYQIIVPFLTFK
ncbi:unnamed protein product [Nesidiocoris tenuis]|uniref:GAF domain-containing protein n=1 Tax=Nesidiocoris tenuis TaxID=355587 RepID=A0A6H5GJY9_9HEMI|nr:unnamed protein product [Nesidiocoris tenuis]